MGCTECHEGLHHCHDVLVVHADGQVECDDAERCGGRRAAHGWVVSCAEVGCGCPDERDGARPVAAAA
jgi:hypothetical protein